MTATHGRFGVLAVVLLVLPFVTDALLGRGWVRIADFALLYIMLALGLNIVVGYAGLLDLGYIAFFAVGAYNYALLASPQFGLHWPVWVVLPLGALLACFFGVLLGAPTLALARRLPRHRHAGLRRDHPHLSQQPERADQHHQRPAGHQPDRPGADRRHFARRNAEIFGITLPSVHLYYYLFLGFTLLVIFVSLRLENSRIGRAWMAIREDEVAAEAMGINTRNIKLLAFAMGATFGGTVRRTVRRVSGFRQPGKFRPDGIDHDPVHGGAGRHGQHRRRGARRRAAGAAAGSVAQRRGAGAAMRCSARRWSIRKACACCCSAWR